jgi:polysaccharide deacetylase 2 family uncharacterized protein YibQ
MMRRGQAQPWLHRAVNLFAVTMIAGCAAYGIGLLSPAAHARLAAGTAHQAKTGVGPSNTRNGLARPAVATATVTPGAAKAPQASVPAKMEVSVARAADRSSIAIVIDDVGYSAAETKLLDGLPPAISFAFLPGGNDVPDQVRGARAAGHEVLLHMPMQPMNGTPLGRFGLTVSESEAQMARRLDAALNEVPGAIGLNNHMGSRFTADPEAMSRFVDVLKGRHLIFLDSRTTPKTVAAETAARAGLPTAQRSVFLDDGEPGKGVVLGELAKAVSLAHANGSVLVIGHPHPATIAALKAWLPTARDDGVALVSLSEHVRRVGEERLMAAAKLASRKGY